MTRDLQLRAMLMRRDSLEDCGIVFSLLFHRNHPQMSGCHALVSELSFSCWGPDVRRDFTASRDSLAPAARARRRLSTCKVCFIRWDCRKECFRRAGSGSSHLERIERTRTSFTFVTGDMAYQPLTARVALIGGLWRAFPVFNSIKVVVEAVG